jgi:hypothetical protein
MSERRGRSAVEVVEAKYGQDGQRWADVTEAVRSILADGRFEVMTAINETFAVDPCPHVVKELRIRYRIGNGEVMEQRFAEGDRIVLP